MKAQELRGKKGRSLGESGRALLAVMKTMDFTQCLRKPH